MPINDSDLAVMFIAPMNAPGVKLFCRTSYEMMASVMGTPFDYPLSSRFDENDAIFVFDNVLIPWENVLLHRDIEKIKVFYPRSGFLNGYQFQGCTRLAVKLDFMVGIIAKALRATGARRVPRQPGDARRGHRLAQPVLGAVRRHGDRTRCPGSATRVLPNAQSGASYRVFAGDAYGRIKEIVEKIVASALIYLPSSARDFANPAIDKYLAKYVRGSHGIDYKERIKIMKLLWDAIGTEFGGRHELYEMQLRRQPRGHPHPVPVERARLRRARSDDRARRALHGRLRRARLDRSEPGSTPTTSPIRACRGRRARRSESDELARSAARRRHGGRLRRHRAGAGAHGRGAAVPRRHEPARRRRARDHHGRQGRPQRLHGDRRVLGHRRAADAARVPQPPQSGGADPARERRVLRQHAGRRMRAIADVFAGRTGAVRESRFAPETGRRSRPARRSSPPRSWPSIAARSTSRRWRATTSSSAPWSTCGSGRPGRRSSITSGLMIGPTPRALNLRANPDPCCGARRCRWARPDVGGILLCIGVVFHKMKMAPSGVRGKRARLWRPRRSAFRLCLVSR